MNSRTGEQVSQALEVGPSAVGTRDCRSLGETSKEVPVEAQPKIEDMQTKLEQQGRELEALRLELENTRLQLKTMREQVVAQEKLATLGAIAAGIAHEIKNPLNFVVNFAALSVDLIAEVRADIADWDGNVTKVWRDNLDESLRMLADNCAKVNQHGLRADGIVRAMQMHARGQAGQTEFTDINRLLEETLALAYHGARSSDREFNVTIEKHLAPNLPQLEVIPQEMGRVFLNLIGNALHAVRVTLKGRTPTIRVATIDKAQAIEIRVGDNGPGIPDEIRSRIFEQFFTTKPVGQGTGLGLAIAREIVEQMHRGSIRFESVTGEGTEFIVELPKKKPAG